MSGLIPAQHEYHTLCLHSSAPEPPAISIPTETPAVKLVLECTGVLPDLHLSPEPNRL
jgi:hypothetical protein